jgi:hypothetical protein
VTELNQHFKEKKRSFLEYVFFFAFGLFLFFLSAFLVVLLRTKGSSKLVMPDLIGQNYLDVHNELLRLRLKVQLETKRFMDKNDGEILYQSIPAGKVLEAGSKLYLTVNIGVDRIVVPDLKGQQLISAKALLEKILSGETYVKMEIGGITYVPASGGLAPGTILEQIPEPGKITTTREKIYLLVVEDKTQTSSVNFENLPFPQVAYSLSKQQKNFRLKEILPTQILSQNGLIAKVEQVNSIYNFSVYYYEIDPKPVQGYEKFVFHPKETGEYSGKLYLKEEKEKPMKELFSKLKLEMNQDFPFIFYRQGDVRVDIETNGKVAKSFNFEADLQR